MVFQPVYHDGDRTIKERWKNLVSFAVAVFRICDLVNASMRGLGKKGCFNQRVVFRKEVESIAKGVSKANPNFPLT